MSAPVLNKVTEPQIDRTAAERSQRPQRPGAPLGGLVLGAAVFASVLLHGALLGTVLIATPRENPNETVDTITVELVPEMPAEPEKAPEPPVPEPKKEPEKKPTPRLEIPDFTQFLAAEKAAQSQPKPIPPKPAATAAVPNSPPTRNTPAADSAAPAQATPSGSATSGAPTADQPQDQPQSQADAPPPSVTETSPQDALAAAARIADLMHLPELTSLGAFDGAPSKNTARLTAVEVAAFRAELRKCWTPPSDVPANQKPRAVIRVALKPDGTFSAQPQLLSVTSPLFGAPVVKNAMQALSQCQPYRSLPAGKYKEWKLLDLAFTAQDVAAVNAIADAKAPPRP